MLQYCSGCTVRAKSVNWKDIYCTLNRHSLCELYRFQFQFIEKSKERSISFRFPGRAFPNTIWMKKWNTSSSIRKWIWLKWDLELELRLRLKFELNSLFEMARSAAVWVDDRNNGELERAKIHDSLGWSVECSSFRFIRVHFAFYLSIVPSASCRDFRKL